MWSSNLCCKMASCCRQTTHKPIPNFSPPEEAASVSQSVLISSSVSCYKKISFDLQQPTSEVKFSFETANRWKRGLNLNEILVKYFGVYCGKRWVFMTLASYRNNDCVILLLHHMQVLQLVAGGLTYFRKGEWQYKLCTQFAYEYHCNVHHLKYLNNWN